MAVTAKLTVKRGAGLRDAEVTLSAGDGETQSDTISLNMDVTKLSKLEVMNMIDAIKQKIEKSPWPLN